MECEIAVVWWGSLGGRGPVLTLLYFPVGVSNLPSSSISTWSFSGRVTII